MNKKEFEKEPMLGVDIGSGSDYTAYSNKSVTIRDPISYKKVKVSDDFDLNLRKNPGMNEPVLTVIPKGTELELLTTDQPSGEWVKTIYENLEGWINKKFISVLIEE